MVSIRRLIFAKREASNQEAFQFKDDLYRYVFARINHAEESEDIVMEVIHGASTYPSAENLKAYMIGVARHKIADHYRRKSLRESATLQNEAYDLSDADNFLRIQTVLQGLGESYQECLVLKYVCGFSSEEIGKMLSMNAGAVDSTLQRARKAFATEWNRLNGEDNE